MDIVISGLLLGGTYVLIAMGLNLQYGVARIMNLANGEMIVLGALASFWVFTSSMVSPLLTLFLVAPVAFFGNWLIYRLLLVPLVRRAKNQGQLEVDSILATFGMSFVLVGIVVFLYLWLNHSRAGMAVRAVAVNPESARLVGINVSRISALAFAVGGAVSAVAGVLISTFITLDASVGVIFTMKALIIVIMGGVGDIRGAIVAALILGLVETAVATLIDPGLTLVSAYLIFLLVLLFRPQGLFGRAPS